MCECRCNMLSSIRGLYLRIIAHHHPHPRKSKNGSMLRQARHKQITYRTAVGTSESRAGYGGVTIVTTDCQIRNLSISTRRFFLFIQHKPHLLRENADENLPCPVPGVGAEVNFHSCEGPFNVPSLPRVPFRPPPGRVRLPPQRR